LDLSQETSLWDYPSNKTENNNNNFRKSLQWSVCDISVPIISMFDIRCTQARAKLVIGPGQMGNLGPISNSSLSIFVISAKYIWFMYEYTHVHVVYMMYVQVTEQNKRRRMIYKNGVGPLKIVGPCQMAHLAPLCSGLDAL